MGIDEEISQEMRDRGKLYLGKMLDRIEEVTLGNRHRSCKKPGDHQWHNSRYGKICDSCWRKYSTRDKEKPTPRDIEIGLEMAHDRGDLKKLRPLYELNRQNFAYLNSRIH